VDGHFTGAYVYRCDEGGGTHVLAAENMKSNSTDFTAGTGGCPWLDVQNATVPNDYRGVISGAWLRLAFDNGKWRTPVGQEGYMKIFTSYAGTDSAVDVKATFTETSYNQETGEMQFTGILTVVKTYGMYPLQNWKEGSGTWSGTVIFGESEDPHYPQFILMQGQGTCDARVHWTLQLREPQGGKDP